MIVLLGASGYVGRAFTDYLQQSGHTFRPVSRRDVDYTDRQTLVTFLRDVRPDYLINAAGYTGRPNVDACEDHKPECLLGNAVLPGILREACEECGVPWGHVSSGCIYTGTRPDGSGFSEQDSPNFTFRTNNCSFYSGTKALGEELLQDASECYIWRLRIPFSHIDEGRNYISKLLRYERLLDVRNSLSHLGEFVAAACGCFEHSAPWGTYNLTNGGSVTTREVVGLIQEAGLSDKPFQFFESEDAFMRVAARTPRSNCVLDNSRALAAGLGLSDVDVALRAALREWKPETEPTGR